MRVFEAETQAEVFEDLQGFDSGQGRHSVLGYLSTVALEHGVGEGDTTLARLSLGKKGGRGGARSHEREGPAVSISVLPDTSSPWRFDDAIGMFEPPSVTCSRRVSCAIIPITAVSTNPGQARRDPSSALGAGFDRG